MAALLVVLTLHAGIAAASPATSVPAEPPAAEPAADPAVAQPAAAIDEASAACAPAEPDAAEPAEEPEAAPAEPPVAVCSQDAGEEQYQDPFANEKPPGEEQGGGNGSEGHVSQAEPADTAVPTTADAAGLPATDGGPQLPSTGLEALPPALLGLLLLLGGAVLRRRVAAASPTNVA